MTDGLWIIQRIPYCGQPEQSHTCPSSKYGRDEQRYFDLDFDSGSGSLPLPLHCVYHPAILFSIYAVRFLKSVGLVL